jgi:hypothetical protein
VGIVAAAYFALNVWLWRKMGWLVKAGLSSLVLLGLLAFAAWQRESSREGIVMLGRQTTSALLSVVTGGAVTCAGIVLARLRFLRLGGRFAVALLTVYAAAAFLSGAVNGQPYPDLFHGDSLLTRLPFWVQGAFVGSFILLPVGVVSLTLSGLLRPRETKFRRLGWTLLFLCLTLTMSVGGFEAPAGRMLAVPFGAGSIEAFVSEDASGMYGVTRPTNQIREDAKRIYLILQGRSTSPFSVEATWLAVNVDGSEPNQKLGSSRLSLEPYQRKAVSLNAPKGGFLPGEYRVQLSVNSGAPQSLLFKVVPILTPGLLWRAPLKWVHLAAGR